MGSSTCDVEAQLGVGLHLQDGAERFPVQILRPAAFSAFELADVGLVQARPALVHAPQVGVTASASSCRDVGRPDPDGDDSRSRAARNSMLGAAPVQLRGIPHPPKISVVDLHAIGTGAIGGPGAVGPANSVSHRSGQPDRVYGAARASCRSR
jgi:hypothetical protein